MPIEAETITPASFAGQTLEKSCALEVRQGNRVLTLGDFFHLDGTVGSNPDDTEVVVIGDLRMVKRIGMGMDGGRMTVIGDAGMYLGAEMRSGRILVKGSVDAWAGAEMSGGNIHIEGDAGDYLCAGYPGSKHGMRGGRVFVSGNAGAEMASHMHRGFIAVKGHVGDHAAARMSGGTIMIGGAVGQRLGLGATRGMVLVMGRAEAMLPTYRFGGVSAREFVFYYVRYLKSRRPDHILNELGPDERWVKYMGDLAEGQPGMEVYLRASLNMHLVPSGWP